MRLALLGCDEHWKSFLRDLPPEHELVAVYEAAEQDLPLNALLPQVQRNEQWESLLIRDDIDLILVASPTQLKVHEEGFDPQARRVDQLKKLAQAGRSLLVSHPGAELLDAYEIEMLRREGGGHILPWFPGLYHLCWGEWHRWEVNASPAGQVNVEWQRQVSSDSRAAVHTALARDLLLIEQRVGKLKRVTALGVSLPQENPSNSSWRALSVQIESATGITIRWTILPRSNPLAAHLTLHTRERERQIQIPNEQAAGWVIHDSQADGDFVWTWNETISTLNYFATMRRSPAGLGDEWLTACRSLETLAAVEKSLQRSRTIELSQTEQTEEHAFKGVMASTGCMLLLLILFAIFIVALVEGLQLPLRNSTIWRLWPVALVVALAGFLGLQFLQAVIQKTPER